MSVPCDKDHEVLRELPNLGEGRFWPPFCYSLIPQLEWELFKHKECVFISVVPEAASPAAVPSFPNSSLMLSPLDG